MAIFILITIIFVGNFTYRYVKRENEKLREQFLKDLEEYRNGDS